MSVSKDFIKFRQHLRTLDLSVNEQYLMELLFEYNNSQFGYSFLEFTDIMKAFNTTSKNRVSATIKKLEKKGLIEVDRRYRNNRYKIIGIENFINTAVKNDVPIEDHEVSNDEKKVMDLGFTEKDAKRLLKAAKDKVEKVVKAFSYSVQKGAADLFKYTLWGIKNINKIKTKITESKEGSQLTKFHNFKEREYDYDSLERRLLGWEHIKSDRADEWDNKTSTFDLRALLAAI